MYAIYSMYIVYEKYIYIYIYECIIRVYGVKCISELREYNFIWKQKCHVTSRTCRSCPWQFDTHSFHLNHVIVETIIELFPCKKKKKKCNAFDRDIFDFRLCATCTGDLNRSKQRVGGKFKNFSQSRKKRKVYWLDEVWSEYREQYATGIVFVVTAPFDYNILTITISFHSICLFHEREKVL